MIQLYVTAQPIGAVVFKDSKVVTAFLSSLPQNEKQPSRAVLI
jgi:hypothetical protein